MLHFGGDVNVKTYFNDGYAGREKNCYYKNKKAFHNQVIKPLNNGRHNIFKPG